MTAPIQHHDWLSLIEISGPFLAIPVLKEAFPQGLEELDASKRKYLRQAYEEWREALELEDIQFSELHVAWINEVLSRVLELDETGKGDVLKRNDWCAANLQANLPMHDITLSPEMAVINEQRATQPLLLIQTYAQNVDLDAVLKQDNWTATPADRMVQLCRSLGCRLGLVTNGERWMLVDAPVGAVTTFASWYAQIWIQEPITLQAFVHLLGIRRFFVDESEQLPALFDLSLKFQDEVTDALSEQVRRAIEVLIQTLDKADQDRNRELLRDVKEAELYEAALTVMMRLVFLLSAEERRLLLMGDECYEANYALSTLRMQLRKESEEILERRWDAWSRLLAVFRVVFGGIEHENLRLPALGGSLFDPDRFPFLEGRDKGSHWRRDQAKPLPIDNRTVLLLLDAIQQFQGRTLSYRALDVEQIGYVYEGLLERTVKRVDEVTLELDATKSAKSPWVKLAELDSAQLDGAARLAELLQERSGSSASRVRNSLAKPVDDSFSDRLLTACQGDNQLRDRVKPYAHMLRTDPWGYPLVYPAGAFIVTTGSDRRETGTHYTPKSLTEAIVTETLTPLVYIGPAEGAPREHWVLKSPADLLDLKICDPAMGSGAFLVQVCRWLSDRLVEAWSQAEASGKIVSVDGVIEDIATSKEPLPKDSEARILIARRLIAERCLYGVDLNPLAVELAKLSIWLVTLAKGRPFGFLDHNLRCGESLLGIHRLDQLTELTMTPGGKSQQRLFGNNIEKAVNDAIELRKRLREIPIRDLHDVEAMARLDAEARRCLEIPQEIANAFVGTIFADGRKNSLLENALTTLAIQAEQSIQGNSDSRQSILDIASSCLSIEVPLGRRARKPFHWPLEFPEVFALRDGFDAMVANPPYLGGRKIRGAVGGTYLEYLTNNLFPNASANADLCAFFVRRCAMLSRSGCINGFIATSSISEGDTRNFGLDYLLKNGWLLIRGASKFPWPGKASVTVSPIWLFKGNWSGEIVLNQNKVTSISPYLTEQSAHEADPYKLKANFELSYQGSIPLGKGFVVPAEVAKRLISLDKKYEDVIYPYLVGQELNLDPNHEPSKWIINFHDWPLDRGVSGAPDQGPVAADYPLCLDIIREHVYPERTRRKPNGEFALRKPLPQKWWIYGDKRPELYAKLSKLKWALAVATQATKYIAFGRVTGKRVYSNAIAIIASDDFSIAGVVSSSLHEVWARRYGSYNLMLIRYSPSDLFDTYPLPRDLLDDLRVVGEKYFHAREQMMSSSQIGLTDFYNAIHNPLEIGSDFQTFRELQIELDTLVARAYGWSDIDLEHGFYKVSYLAGGDEIRFTISETARLRVLSRLLDLNRQRYEEEAEQGAQVASGRPAKPRAKRSMRIGDDSIQPTLEFNASASMGTYSADPVTSVLNFLMSHNGWHTKADIVNATNISDSHWKPTLDELLANGKIERQGERRGARYRAKDVKKASQ